ncbi:hypothetical protein SAMN03159371_03724 [Variovorax sp. NFACC28]|nr:hypothetical protein SAMN03159371_03724 [Variovorax sp. NFACC28]SEG78361.1 hypothetical protein SAMN03159365_03803 [Variovorax sp. NFACC29]SFC95288.1 hypothetical protein SAMN03159379_03621 [Variovorax sp. NFACC26]SFG08555.1 hypothetical protein SAMN03159447_01729 [Variovorax sp. NFACC27]
MANKKLPQLVLMLLPLLVLSSGCAHNSTPSAPPSVQPALRPSLPVEARQPKPPSICLPSCSAGVERLFGSWGDSLTLPTAPAPSASDTPTR